jgi:lambda family phage portal protein
LAYYVYKRHPGNGGGYSEGNLKRVPAERFLHLAVRERLSGLRGISLFASAIDRLLDIKDYEESERTAARIAARIAAYIKRDVDMQGWVPPTNEDGTEREREFLLEAGAIFTDTAPGESIEMVNPSRPNTALGDFRMNMLRAASRPAQLSYSSFAGDYDGTYSAQRQELVESFDGYRMLTGQFVARFVQPIYQRFISLAIASGALKVPAHIRPETVMQAEFRGPKMPWIDPQKEAQGLLLLARGGWQSLQQGIADRGGRLQDVFEQLARERELAKELGLVLDSDARNTSRAGVTQAPAEGADTPDPDENEEAANGGGRVRQRRPRQRATHTGHGAH